MSPLSGGKRTKQKLKELFCLGQEIKVKAEKFKDDAPLSLIQTFINNKVNLDSAIVSGICQAQFLPLSRAWSSFSQRSTRACFPYSGWYLSLMVPDPSVAFSRRGLVTRSQIASFRRSVKKERAERLRTHKDRSRRSSPFLFRSAFFALRPNQLKAWKRLDPRRISRRSSQI